MTHKFDDDLGNCVYWLSRDRSSFFWKRSRYNKKQTQSRDKK